MSHLSICLAEYPFVVACDQCRMEYLNWPGSTPCCGSIASKVCAGAEAMEHPLVKAAIAEGRNINKTYAP